MQKIIQFLSGKKSIGGTIILGVLGVLASAGVVSVDATWFQIVTLVVGVLTGISFRAAVAKSGPAPVVPPPASAAAAPVVKSEPLDSISR